MIDEKVIKSFVGRNVLVTGGTGLIGRQVVDFICNTGAKVKITSLDRINVNDQAEHIYGDLTNFEFCKDITKGMDCVFHIAGVKGSLEVTKTKPANFFVPLLMVLSVLPPFILSLVLLDLLAFRLELFPVTGGAYTPSAVVDWGSSEFWLDVLHHAALPALSLFLVLVGTYAMGMRGMLVTVLGEDFITFADAKGVRKMRLFLNYAVRNVMLPQATTLAMSLGTVVTGATLVEAMFGYPGLGSVLEDAIRGFDYNLIQGCVFFLIVGIALTTFVLDLIYPLLDPRIRYGKV